MISQALCHEILLTRFPMIQQYIISYWLFQGRKEGQYNETSSESTGCIVFGNNSNINQISDTIKHLFWSRIFRSKADAKNILSRFSIVILVFIENLKAYIFIAKTICTHALAIRDKQIGVFICNGRQGFFRCNVSVSCIWYKTKMCSIFVTTQPQPSSKNKAGAKPGSSKFQILFLQTSGSSSDHGSRSLGVRTIYAVCDTAALEFSLCNSPRGFFLGLHQKSSHNAWSFVMATPHNFRPLLTPAAAARHLRSQNAR